MGKVAQQRQAVGLNPEMGTSPGLIYPSPDFFALILQVMISTAMTENQTCFYSPIEYVGQTRKKMMELQEKHQISSN